MNSREQNQKLIKLVQHLTKKTSEGSLSWSKPSRGSFFSTVVGEHEICLDKTLRWVETEYGEQQVEDYKIALLDSDGLVVDEATDEDLSANSTRNIYQDMKLLFRLARASARGGDAVLDDILASLGEDEEADEEADV